ncbi:GLPGLI family protein [Frigoriflavimonas asaccharolytica]|uniref:GLPGLI family protein n=1 Tax=Frigoriflavimonas asaccharolytica TaxID=2735899 RepID=A0A8J8KAB3_9FLAO|nr:GLPGLI family protein [Frigoriflavimonas asaccharolytica]NRS93977.1 GLPGLI family protein [Frigoriflavimonas asaccharolytica]
MKKQITILMLLFAFTAQAQVMANRFFYELTYKPKKDSAKLQNVMTVLDIVPGKSVYQDYIIVEQDSVRRIAAKKLERDFNFDKMMNSVVNPKFTYRVSKEYPSMKSTYQDAISMKVFGYDEQLKFDWKILPERQKIEEYNTQKATVDFGGRKWTAWFSTDIPFSDGPYKFSGLPGLIVKIEDAEKNYSWLLKGNKTVEVISADEELEKKASQYGLSTKVSIIPKEKFEKAYQNYKADPLAEARPMMSNKEVMNMKLPGSEMTMAEMLKKAEKMANEMFNSNNNPIEIQ